MFLLGPQSYAWNLAWNIFSPWDFSTAVGLTNPRSVSRSRDLYWPMRGWPAWCSGRCARWSWPRSQRGSAAAGSPGWTCSAEPCQTWREMMTYYDAVYDAVDMIIWLAMTSQISFFLQLAREEFLNWMIKMVSMHSGLGGVDQMIIFGQVLFPGELTFFISAFRLF